MILTFFSSIKDDCDKSFSIDVCWILRDGKFNTGEFKSSDSPIWRSSVIPLGILSYLVEYTFSFLYLLFPWTHHHQSYHLLIYYRLALILRLLKRDSKHYFKWIMIHTLESWKRFIYNILHRIYHFLLQIIEKISIQLHFLWDA